MKITLEFPAYDHKVTIEKKDDDITIYKLYEVIEDLILAGGALK
jgi:hypothetical protein